MRGRRGSQMTSWGSSRSHFPAVLSASSGHSRARPRRDATATSISIPGTVPARLDSPLRSCEYWRDRARRLPYTGVVRGARQRRHASAPSSIPCSVASPSKESAPMDMCGIFLRDSAAESGAAGPEALTRHGRGRCATAGPTRIIVVTSMSARIGARRLASWISRRRPTVSESDGKIWWSATARSTMLPSCGGKRPHGVIPPLARRHRNDRPLLQRFGADAGPGSRGCSASRCGIETGAGFVLARDPRARNRVLDRSGRRTAIRHRRSRRCSSFPTSRAG